MSDDPLKFNQMRHDLEVAQTIISQLGGKPFLDAVKTRQIIIQREGLVLVFTPVWPGRPDAFEVVLTPEDTYDVRVARVNREAGENECPLTIVKHLPDVYCDQLLPIFEEETGIETGIEVEWTSGPG